MAKESNRNKVDPLVETSKLYTPSGDIYDKPITKQLEILADRRAQVKKRLIQSEAEVKECKSELQFLTDRLRSITAKIKMEKLSISASENKESGRRFMDTAKKYLPRSTYDDLINITFNGEE